MKFEGDGWEFNIADDEQMLSVADDEQMLSVAKEDLAYIAGIIDGEGSISCSNTNKRKSIIPRVRIQMKDDVIVPWLFHILQFGNFKYSKKQEQYYLEFGGDNMVIFLCLIFPYLKLKKPQANLALAIKYLQDQSTTHCTYQREKQFALATNMSELNNKFRTVKKVVNYGS